MLPLVTHEGLASMYRFVYIGSFGNLFACKVFASCSLRPSFICVLGVATHGLSPKGLGHGFDLWCSLAPEPPLPLLPCIELGRAGRELCRAPLPSCKLVAGACKLPLHVFFALMHL